MKKNTKVKPAGFFIRMAAAYLNFILFLSVVVLTVIPLTGIEIIESIAEGKSIVLDNEALLFSLIILFYLLLNIGLQGTKGANMGKLILGLKVVDEKNMESIGLLKSTARAILSIFSFLFLGLGILVIPFNKKKKSMHDFFVGSYVIHDPHSVVHMFIRRLVGFVMILVFLATLLLTPALITGGGYLLYQKFNYFKKFPIIGSEAFKANPEASLNFPVKAGEITLSFPRDEEESKIKFKINKKTAYNRLSEASMKELGIGIKDLDFSLDFKEGKPRLIRKYRIPKFVIIDTNGKKLIAKNFIFKISKDRNLLGTSFLNYFPHSISETSLKLSLDKSDRELFKENISDEARSFKSLALKRIDSEWQAAKDFIPVEVLNEISKSTEPVSNEVEIKIESDRGYVTSIKFLKPSKVESFNEYCQKFLNEIDRFSNLPKEIKADESFQLSYKFSVE